MNLGIRESVALARGVLRSLRGEEETPEVVICPPFTALSEVRKVLARSRVQLGAQSCGVERSGAYTGDVSVAMLEDVSCGYVIIGHSERRARNGETNEMIQKKMQAVADSKLTSILCVGESKDVRSSGDEYNFVREQVRTAFDGVTVSRRKKVVIAYEPIWAIGSGEAASVGEIIEMHRFIREEAARLTDRSEEEIVILYGGSATDDNAYQFLREREIDGLLVGGASLKLHVFNGILKAGIEVIVAQQ